MARGTSSSSLETYSSPTPKANSADSAGSSAGSVGAQVL